MKCFEIIKMKHFDCLKLKFLYGFLICKKGCEFSFSPWSRTGTFSVQPKLWGTGNLFSSQFYSSTTEKLKHCLQDASKFIPVVPWVAGFFHLLPPLPAQVPLFSLTAKCCFCHVTFYKLPDLTRMFHLFSQLQLCTAIKVPNSGRVRENKSIFAICLTLAKAVCSFA